MGEPVSLGYLEVLSNRAEVLRALGDGSTTKAELESRLDVSRSTVDRAIRELAEYSLVERTGDGYRQTLPGRLGHDVYDRFTRCMGGLADATELFVELDRDVEVDPAFLAGADVVMAEQASPHRPIEELYSYVERASRVRGFAPAVHPQQVDTYLEQVSEEGMHACIVLTEEAVQRLISEYDDALREGLSFEHASLYRTDADLAYSLTIADLDDRTVAGLMLYGPEGSRGVVINDDDEAVDWAVDRYETVRDGATEVG